MSYCLKSQDWSALVIARKLIKLGVKDFEITLGAPENSFSLIEMWQKALDNSLQGTQFGRIGFLYDESNQAAHDFCQNLKSLNYKPKDEKRALKAPRYTIIPTQILKPMADCGWEDSVEFRRIARKYIRPLKHAHVDTLILLEPIFADEKIQKVIQHLAGTQIKIITPVDFWEPISLSEENDSVKIMTFYSREKTQDQAKRLLKRKVSKEDITVL